MQDKEFAAILQDEPMQPLALVPLTEEEQVCREHVLRGIRIPACAFHPRRTGPVFQQHVLSVNKTRSSHSCPFALSILYLCSAEEFLYVCEQRSGAEAHGKGSGRGCTRRGG